MPLQPLLDAVQRPFLDLAPELSGCLLYLDEGAAEVVHSSLGIAFLMGLGVTNICSLEAASPADALLTALHLKAQAQAAAAAAQPQQERFTLVICITKLLSDRHADIVRAVAMHCSGPQPQLQQLLLLSAVSEHAHACQPASVLGVEAFAEYASMLRSALQAPSTLQISVRHLPLHFCVLDPRTLLLPAAGAAAAARCGAAAAGYAAPDAAASPADPEAAAGSLSLLSHALGGVVSQLGARLETFYLGPTAQLLASKVHSLPLPPPPEAPGRPAPTLALVLVDRSLDLASPCSHGDHPLDLVFSSLRRHQPPTPPPTQHASPPPERPSAAECSYSLGLRIPLVSSLRPGPGGSSQPQQQQEQQQQCGAGERLELELDLLSPSDRGAAQRLDRLHCSRPKDALQLLRKWLKEGLRSEKLGASVRSRAGAVPVSELLSLVTDLTGTGTGAGGSRAVRQRGLLGAAAAVVDALHGAEARRWEAAAGLERQVLLLMIESGDMAGLLALLLDALGNAQAQGPLLVSDVLQVLPLVYSLWPDACPPGAAPQAGGGAGPFSPQQQQQLQQALHASMMHALGLGGGPGAPPIAAGAAAMQQQLDCLPPAVVSRLAQLHAAGANGRRAAQEQLAALLRRFFARLQYIGAARLPLQDLRRVTTSDLFSDADAVRARPLVQQLLHGLLHSQECADLRQPGPASGALSGIISKGLGHFGLPGFGSMAPARPQQPWQCSAVLVFVVGGISLAEARGVRQALEEAAAAAAAVAGAGAGAGGGGAGGDGVLHVLVGGTALVSPRDVCRQLLS